MSNIPSPIQMAKSIIVFGGAQIFSVLAALVRGKYSALMIGVAGVGLNGLFISISTFISNLVSLGISTSAVSSLSQSFENDSHEVFVEKVSSIRRISMLTAMIGSLIAVVSSPLFSYVYYDDFGHVTSFSVLAFVVISTIICNNEVAILKAARESKLIISQSVIAAVSSVVIIFPFYYYMGIDGVIWALAASSMINAIVVLVMSLRICPFIVNREGFQHFLISIKPIVMLGMAFVAAGLVLSISDLVIQSYFETTRGLDVLGLYRAGYQVSVVYVGMVFTAINNDYFPCLSAIVNNIHKRNTMINRQIIVLLLLTIPLVTIFIAVVPWIVPLLYSHEFDAIIGFVRWSSIGIIFKSIYLPMEYLPIVTGKSKHFFMMETINVVIMSMGIIIGNELGDLNGVGIGFLLGQVIEAVWVYFFMKKNYQFAIQWKPKE